MNNELIKLISIVGCAFIVGLIFRFVVLRSTLSKRLKSNERSKKILKSVTVPILFLSLTIGLKYALSSTHFSQYLTPPIRTALSILIIISGTVCFFRFSNLVELILKKSLSKSRNRIDDMLAPVARKSIQVLIIMIAVLLVAQNLSGKTMASILTGLGVGGLALALASQETLKNFFGSIVICSDKPFALNDRVRIGDIDGTVEGVGFRSTRIRTLNGHQVTIPNGELANKNIENISRRPHIRRTLNLGITYDTPPEKVDQAVQIIKELLENHEGMDAEFPPRVFFDDFGTFSLNILAIYWYHPADYWAFKAFSENFNMQLLKRLNAEGIDFAFPSQTLYLASDENRPLKLNS